MDGNLGMAPEIGLALRRERLAEANRERQAREVTKHATPRMRLASLRARMGAAAGIIRTPRIGRGRTAVAGLRGPMPRLI